MNNKTTSSSIANTSTSEAAPQNQPKKLFEVKKSLLQPHGHTTPRLKNVQSANTTSWTSASKVGPQTRPESALQSLESATMFSTITALQIGLKNMKENARLMAVIKSSNLKSRDEVHLAQFFIVGSQAIKLYICKFFYR